MSAAGIGSDFSGIQKERETYSQETKKNIIKNVATASLKQLVISLAMVGVCCAFTATPNGIILLCGSAAGTFAFSALGRVVHGNFEFDKQCLKYEEELSEKYGNTFSFDDAERLEFLEKATRLMGYIAPMNFATLNSLSTDVLTHEGAHAATATALFHHADAHVALTPGLIGKAGLTTYSLSGHLTGLGELFGRHASEMIVAGAGTGATFLTSIISLVVAHKIRKTHPEASRALKCAAIMSIANSVLYAFSALWTSSKNMAHDFVHLAAGGVNPLVAVVFMIAVPLIIKGGMALVDYYKEQKQRKAEEPERVSVVVASDAEN